MTVFDAGVGPRNDGTREGFTVVVVSPCVPATFVLIAMPHFPSAQELAQELAQAFDVRLSSDFVRRSWDAMD